MTRSERLAVAGLVAFFATAYITYGLFRHWSFHTSWDLAIFDQAVWHLARFERPASSLMNVGNIFGDHFHPIIVLFAPAYWLVPAPESLIVLQGLLLASAIVPIFMFLRRRLPAGPALTLCVSYGFFWGIQQAAAFDVHEVAFAPLVIALTVLALDEQRWTRFWIAIVLLMLIKEDLIPLATFFGLYLAVTGRWPQGLALAGISAAVFVFLLVWFMPWLIDGGYTHTGIYGDLLQHPWRVPLALVTPPGKLLAVVLWIAPFAFLPMCSPLIVLTVPLALERLLAHSSNYWGISFHYAAPLAPLLVMSAGDGLHRLVRRIRRPAVGIRFTRWAAGVSIVFSMILPGNQPFWDLFSFEHYRPHPDRPVWEEMATLIPAAASVTAQAALLPHLSHRQSIYMLDETARDADFVVTTSRLSPWPAPDQATRASWIEARVRAGYHTIFERDGWMLLRRGRAVDAAGQGVGP